MSKQKTLEEFYELGALRLLRVEKLPNESVEQICRHTVVGFGKDDPPTCFWARRVFRTRKETYAQVTFCSPIKRGQQPPVWVPPGLYQVMTKR